MLETKSVLEKINSNEDLKKLSIDELESLSNEMRDLIIKKVNTIGGHLGPNLGVVEMTIALHKVFNTPRDKFVFDVSHQCYTHKMITGRKETFTNPELYLKYSGYTAPEESEHDLFKVGHTSTSVSLALGLAKARDLKQEKHNVIAIIGDGSLSGGEAFEGFNNAATLGSNFIIVVNDNEMSIAENQGGLYSNLRLLRETNGEAECNIFKSLGFDYRYLEYGNDLSQLIDLFNCVKDIDHPIVLHIHTLKGKGSNLAESQKERFHWMSPGELDRDLSVINNNETYEKLTTDYILSMKAKGEPVVAITAATPAVSGFTKKIREQMGENFVDVGIAEEHAVAYASGLAKGGAKPIFAVMSSFVQRAYDQLLQDLALNNNPATILVFWGGITGMDATHLTKYDIPMISNMPNLVYLAPTNKEEYLSMLEWSTHQNEHSVVIRVPLSAVTSMGKIDNTDYSKLNKFKVTKSGAKVAIIGVGSYYDLAQKVVEEMKNKLRISATLINPIYLTGVDKDVLEDLKINHDIVVTLESGSLEGGFGDKISSFYNKSKMKVLNYGANKEFTDRVSQENLFDRYKLIPEKIVEDIENTIFL